MASETVLIGCKMPTGVTLDLDSYELLSKEHGTVRLVKGKLPPVTLKGNAARFGVGDQSNRGYVFTPVSREFWDAWMATHADSSLLVDRFIIAANSNDAANKIARDHETERGLNPRLIEGDERTRGLRITAADEMKDRRPREAA